MRLYEIPEGVSELTDLLYCLGVTEKYTGHYFTSYAVQLAAAQPERLYLVTKWIYPDVARYFRTDWRNVERGIRSAAELAWELRPDKLASIANSSMECRPSNSQFIAILTNYFVNQTGDPFAIHLPRAS